MLIFRLKPGVICSQDAHIRLSDVAYGLCEAGYEDVMSLLIHAPSTESYNIDALDITRAVSNAFPDLRVEMRGQMVTRVCPVKTTVYQFNTTLQPVPGASSSQTTTSPILLAEHKDPKNVKPRFFTRILNMLKTTYEGGKNMQSNCYQKIPQCSLDYQPRPGDREERMRTTGVAETREKKEAGDNATKEP